jgi:Fic family protein
MIDKRESIEEVEALQENKKISEAKEQFLQLITTVMNNKFSLNEYYEDSDSLDIIISQVDELKVHLDSFRPLDSKHVAKLDRYFEEYYTYDSTSIEGNTLTLQETTLVLNKGITIGGKSMREHLEVINHNEAIEYIKTIVKNQEEFNQKTLLDIHYLILKSIDTTSSGKYRNIDVMISGSRHKPPTFLQVQNLMDKYFEFYEANKNDMHPVLLSAYMHEKLVTVHPFVDGNGRTSRLVMNLILLQNGYPITNISSQNEQRANYYSTLEKVQINEDENGFLLFIAKNVKDALIKYLEVIAMNGEQDTKGEEFYKMIVEKNKK